MGRRHKRLVRERLGEMGLLAGQLLLGRLRYGALSEGVPSWTRQCKEGWLWLPCGRWGGLDLGIDSARKGLGYFG